MAGCEEIQRLPPSAMPPGTIMWTCGGRVIAEPRVSSREQRDATSRAFSSIRIAFMRALDWKNASERRRLARILKAARETIEGGICACLFHDRDGRES